MTSGHRCERLAGGSPGRYSPNVPCQSTVEAGTALTSFNQKLAESSAQSRPVPKSDVPHSERRDA